MDNKISNRIEQARDYAGLSQNDLGAKIGKNRKTIMNYEAAISEPTVSLVQKIAHHTGTNEWWMLTGKGKMIEKENKKSSISVSVSGNNISESANVANGNNSNINTTSNQETEQDLVVFDYYPDVLASAGYGAHNGDVIKASKVYLDKNFVRTVLSLDVSKNLDIVGVMGDSMEPFVKDGEQVIVHRTNIASDNQVVIANIKGAIYVKRLLKDPFGNWVKLISDNDNYPPITIEGEDLNYLTIIGVVKAKIKLF